MVMDMERFLIKRGHNGPARRGSIQFKGFSLETPALAGHLESVHTDIQSVSMLKEIEGGDSPLLLSTGTLLSYDLSIPDDILSRSLVLAPSLSGIPGLSPDAAKTILIEQVEMIKEQNYNSQYTLRIPSSITLEDLEELIPSFVDAGVYSASFLFNDELGDHDIKNLRLRSLLPRHWLTIALGRIRPSMIPILFYAGFDIIDTGYAEEAANRLVRVWPLTNEQLTVGKPARYCTCSHCQQMNVNFSHSELESVILDHNLGVYKSQLSEALHAIRDRSLRRIVETSTHSSPGVTSFLRKIDSQNYEFFEEFTPTGGSGKLPLIGPESYNAPAVRRFREKVAKRYIPPAYKKLILLLPCSARKPYSDSKTLRRYAETLDRVLSNRRDSISETIVTSPLGIVPRELERIYPAANYDIPVTGDWDEEETSIAADALVTHLEKFNEDDVVIAHVSGGYLSVVRMAEERIKQSIIYTAHEDSPTRKVSLIALEETLLDLLDIKQLEGRRSLLEDTVRATADYQFGNGAGNVLVPKDAKVGGKVYGTIIIRDQGEQTCAYKGSNGTISLTLEGAKRIESLGKYWVKFEGTTLDGSTLFAVGVKSADYGIRPGDEVLIKSAKGEVVGVGRSEMSGREMCDFDNGIAVKVRHKTR